MSDIAVNDLVSQLEEFSFKQKLSVLRAVVHSFRHKKTDISPNSSKAASLYGLIKDSSVTLEEAKAERLAKI